MNFKKRLPTIILGLILVVSTGSLVYKTKKPVLIPIVTETPVINNESSEEPIPTKTDIQITPKPPVVEKPIPTPLPVTIPKTEPAPSGISLSEIAKHDSRSSCWSTINGYVYDLTSWIPNHPGGERRILEICGIDGSGDYNGEHGGSRKIATILAGFKIGVLAK